MFKADEHQAQGLVGWDVPMPIRVIPVVQDEHDHTSAYLVHALRTGLRALGHEVVCLSQGQDWQRQDWCQPPQVVLQRITAAQHGGEVVVLSMPLEVMATVFDGAQLRPLVAWQGDKRGSVTAYNALKVLREVADLQPVLVPMWPQDVGQQALAAEHLAWLLQCTQAVLAWQPCVWHVRVDEAHHAVKPMTNLLKLLESSVAVSPIPTVVSSGFGAADVQRQRHA